VELLVGSRKRARPGKGERESGGGCVVCWRRMRESELWLKEGAANRDYFVCQEHHAPFNQNGWSISSHKSYGLEGVGAQRCCNERPGPGSHIQKYEKKIFYGINEFICDF